MATSDEAMFGRALDLVALAQGVGAPTLEALTEALDHLASAFAAAAKGSFVADATPRAITPVKREQIASRFPDLGLYAVCNPLDLQGAPLVADAIDDLLDITTQMQEFLALSDHPDEALRQLHALAGHWMAHLRGLSSYLHARRYGW